MYQSRARLFVNGTQHPKGKWVTWQLREVLPLDSIPRHLIFDRDKISCHQVKEFIQPMGAIPKIISYHALWQNGVAERWSLPVKTELFNHLIILSGEHLWCRLKEYAQYDNDDRIHLSLDRNTTIGRQIQRKLSESFKVISLPRLDGRHLFPAHFVFSRIDFKELALYLQPAVYTRSTQENNLFELKVMMLVF